MADQIEKKVVLDITAPGAAVTIADLKDNIKLLKEQLAGAKIGTKEYQDALNELKLNQNALKDANYATSASLETVTQAAAGSGNSYNALVHRLAALKEEYRTLDPAIEGQGARMGELANQINEVNGTLKAYDANIGNYQRNVGNYTNSIVSALGGITKGLGATAGGARGAIGAVSGLTAGFQALSATPVVAILGLVANVLSKVIDGLKSSEENTRAMREALAVFEPILNATTNALQAMGAALVKVVEWAGKAAQWLGIVNESSKETVSIAQEENALIVEKRALTVEVARVQAQVADLQAKAADREKYTAKQRMDFAKQAADLEEQIFNRRYALQQRENALLERKSALTGNDKAANDALAEGQAKLYQLDAERANRQRNITQQANQAARDLQTQATATATQAKDDLKEIEAQLKDVTDAAQRAADDSFAAWEKAQDEALKAQTSYEARRLSDLDKGTARRQQAAEMEIEDARTLEARKEEIALDGLRRRAELLEQFTADAYARGDLQTALKYEEQLQDAQYEIEYKGFQERKRLRDQEAADRQAVLEGLVGSTVSILGSIADAYEAAGDMSEAEAKRMKGLRIAGAIIETLAGAVAAYMSGIKSGIPAPGNMILAATSAAATLAAGYAQVAKIQSTDATGKGSASVSRSGMQAASVNAPAPVQMVPVTRSLTSATEEERLNRMADDRRVVLVYSDVQQAGQHVDVVATETDLR